jgi:hypothetical protein
MDVESKVVVESGLVMWCRPYGLEVLPQSR